MRALPLLLVLLLSGCAEVESPGEPVVSLDPVDFEPEPVIQPPEGRIEVRWPDGAWQSALSWSDSRRANATGSVTNLSLDGVPDRFEARFVGELDPNATWHTRWWTWSPSCCAGAAAQGREASFPAGVGHTNVVFEAWSDTRNHRFQAETSVAVALEWVVHGTVQPLPVQVPGAPPVLQEVRVPVGGVGGTLRLTTEALGEAPPSGRDLRLGYKMLYEEWCMGDPPAGTLDHTSHLLEVPLWGEASTVQAFVGNPSGWCGGLGGPRNAEPIEYVLRVQVAQPSAGGLYVH